MIIKYSHHCSVSPNWNLDSLQGNWNSHSNEDINWSSCIQQQIWYNPSTAKQHATPEERIYPFSRALFSYCFVMQIVQRIILSLLLPRSADLGSIQLNPAPREPADSDQRPLINQLHPVHDNNNNNNIRKRYIMWVCTKPTRVKLIRRTLHEALREFRKRNVCYTGENLPCLALPCPPSALLLWSTCLILVEWSITILLG